MYISLRKFKLVNYRAFSHLIHLLFNKIPNCILNNRNILVIETYSYNIQ